MPFFLVILHVSIIIGWSSCVCNNQHLHSAVIWTPLCCNEHSFSYRRALQLVGIILLPTDWSREITAEWSTHYRRVECTIEYNRVEMSVGYFVSKYTLQGDGLWASSLHRVRLCEQVHYTGWECVRKYTSQCGRIYFHTGQGFKTLSCVEV